MVPLPHLTGRFVALDDVRDLLDVDQPTGTQLAAALLGWAVSEGQPAPGEATPEAPVTPWVARDVYGGTVQIVAKAPDPEIGVERVVDAQGVMYVVHREQGRLLEPRDAHRVNCPGEYRKDGGEPVWANFPA